MSSDGAPVGSVGFRRFRWLSSNILCRYSLHWEGLNEFRWDPACSVGFRVMFWCGFSRYSWVPMGSCVILFFYQIDGCCSVSDGGLQKCRRSWWYCWFLKVIYTSSKMMLVGYDDVESKVMSIMCITTESSIVPTADAGPKPGCLIKWWALLRHWWCSSKMRSGMMMI